MSVKIQDMAKTKQETLKALGKKIKSLRKENGLTQEKLAEQLRISIVYVGFLEAGKGSPSLKLLMKISRKFKVRVEDLFHR
ncbi:MAG: Transcriptional regulator, XRE family [Candidatus Woesebacteria bacterium GW2011_GWB1_39_10]|uniref:Transcriptional regulator, XRE family n=2 Tax=Candidatus Woeseibacteriota TaxID=1752722 RepID=A0A0G0P2B3_9BACT|nr:MAG: Transcriptional regulator, XRE family [Candidatus Woesebacteria bacterium GW2011_GWB1_39_10]KKS91199.1 MAG: Transcriptional regulator, XRE family [Candidatus Woesebacteria bacterium GW2011_GWA1_43_12]